MVIILIHSIFFAYGDGLRNLIKRHTTWLKRNANLSETPEYKNRWAERELARSKKDLRELRLCLRLLAREMRRKRHVWGFQPHKRLGARVTFVRLLARALAPSARVGLSAPQEIRCERCESLGEAAQEDTRVAPSAREKGSK